MTMEQAVELKNQGNSALKNNNFDKAIGLYTQAIELDPTQAVFYSNRAQAYIKTEAFGLAVEDGTKSIEADPNYTKGYYRRAVANAAILKYKEAIKDLKVVLVKAPGDKVAKQYHNEFVKILKQKKFEDAIRGEDTPSAMSQVDFNNPIVGKNPFKQNQLDITVTGTDGKTNEQHIEVNGITKDFIDEMIDIFKRGEKLPKKYAYALIIACNNLLKQEPSMVNISLPNMKKNGKNEVVLEGVDTLTVCGDTHGQFYDLLNIFETYGWVNDRHAYLFNGDFVDRGSWSTEVAFLLYALKLRYPHRLFLNRGNHETNDMNKVYGFEGECKAKYSETLYLMFSESFGSLPLATLIGNDYLVMHGGLFSDDNITLDDIRKINRFKATQPPKEGIEMELLWTDPQPMPGRTPNRRGIGIQFGPDVTEKFCVSNDLSGIIRSHEVRMEGYEKEHNDKLITVFSAPNYCDSQGNKGAIINFTVKNNGEFNLDCEQFEAVPHPDIKPMAYTTNFGL
ncbi:protein serine/threonine phosphatase [Saccharomycopsis crataegensis]|uniref:Serine/threonine-protein phosphatase n=1 Tax=Saccharomycopsis crataegensis TaxID=43959 RepID=A0AAV5QPK5_9ASCO|nr:protein serine/threonine phosphatase [Saccharomycopsis crataegensis]